MGLGTYTRIIPFSDFFTAVKSHHANRNLTEEEIMRRASKYWSSLVWCRTHDAKDEADWAIANTDYFKTVVK